MRKQKYARKIRKQKRLLAGVGLLTVAIILSTVFLKQHSVIDVAAAILLNIICYQMYYKLIPMRYRKRTPSVDEGESVFYF